ITNNKIGSLIKNISSETSVDSISVRQFYNFYEDTLEGYRKTIIQEIQNLTTDTLLKFYKINKNFKKWVFSDIEHADPSIKYLKKLVDKDSTIVIANQQHKDYDSLIDAFKKKTLWTASIADTSYSSGALSKSVQVSSELLTGLYSKSKTFNLELDIKASINYVDDTLSTGKNLNRQVFTFEPGINLVINGKKNHKSYLEFKVSGSYINIWKGLYANENQITNTINGTLRIRILDDIWIPIQIKYDTKNHNLFGFLNVTTNFTGLSNLLKGSSSKSKNAS
ncbi:MAG TPA: hypothetical protein VKT28_22300, partial [Puia sp.]|nr:hypothetical protein [Puia sp.]